ncbi:MAG: hypothetical protein JW750_00160, partial [Anaerolineaceae bacterium]|nr:hypothetical protein [Anaerolineaceae bacterium]
MGLTACGEAPTEETTAVDSETGLDVDETTVSEEEIVAEDADDALVGEGEVNRRAVDGELTATNLVLGIFSMEDSENEVTGEQAAVLLPLWKVYQSLIESSIAAAVEQEALFNQILSEMS